MHASMYENVAAIELQLVAKAAVDRVAGGTRTALMYASAGGHSASIEQLLAAKAPVDHADYEGTTASCMQAGLDALHRLSCLQRRPL